MWRKRIGSVSTSPYLHILILLLAFPLPAYASSRDDLEQTQKALEESRTRQAQLIERSGKLENELKDLQEKLVKAATAVQHSEAELSDAEEKLRILNEQLKDKNAALAAQKKSSRPW